MDKPKINKIVIAGGGTAGWMAAAVMAKVLGVEAYDISLVESDEIGTVGVGEATIPVMQTFLKFLGVSEADFIRETNGTYKLGIEFTGWNKPNESYFHPFGPIGKPLGGVEFIHFWLRRKGLNPDSDFSSVNAESRAAKDRLFGAFNRKGKEASQPLSYAYHFDATLFAKYLRGFCERLEVKRIEGRIDYVDRSLSTGHVTGLSLNGGRKVEGHLFFDCTGFRSVLSGGALGVGYEDWSSWLPCDSAVAMPSERVDEPIPPFTRAVAESAGWRWQIPLQNRYGNGYVYASSSISDDEAAATLISQVKAKPLAEPKVLRFKSGYRKQPWCQNVIALGLAGGFLEPLESTSIYLIHKSLSKVLAYFPKNEINQSVVDIYNREILEDYVNIRDFLVAHYHLTGRSDSDFWNHCQTMEIPGTLSRRLDVFKRSANSCVATNELFKEHSWIAMLIGQRFYPESYHPLADVTSAYEIDRNIKVMENDVSAKTSRLPTHEQFLTKVYGSPKFQDPCPIINNLERVRCN